MRQQNFSAYLLRKLLMLMKFSMLPRLVCLLKLELNLLHMIKIQGRELYLQDFVMDVFDTGWHPDAFDSISFKIGVLIDTSIVYSLIPG